MAFSQVTRGNRMGRSIRTQRWRYTEWGEDGKFGIELYDHSKDSGEYFNLASNPELDTLRGRLKQVLDQGFSKNEPFAQ